MLGITTRASKDCVRPYAKGTLTKENVNKRGYNKFLDISRDITVSINEDKIR